MNCRQLAANAIHVQENQLQIADFKVPIEDVERLVVVGAGKAAGHMALGVEDKLLATPFENRLSGWINVPEDCVFPTQRIHLHAARPSGVNEPRPEGVAGAKKILDAIADLNERDLCLVLLTGGGSALLPAPIDGVSLDDKLEITRYLSAAGADIRELNCVRKQLSRIKGGGLLHHGSAATMITLIVSDVLGDPLDVIASGPTVPNSTNHQDAMMVLKKYGYENQQVWTALQRRSNSEVRKAVRSSITRILGNNQSAIDACARKAVKLGMEFEILPTNHHESSADIVGVELVQLARSKAQQFRDSKRPLCILSGGEPTVTLADEAIRGMGGRNQQLVLAALQHLTVEESLPPAIGLLSGGSDGEDGPTDAAGAMIWPDLILAARQSRLSCDQHLARNDAYRFFGPSGALIRTGPTGTNVCDIRVMICG